jgi:Arm DNA-binding domain
VGLTALEIKNAGPLKRLSDGGGLRLEVDRAGNKSWIFRFTSPVTGKERYMGLGPLADVGLQDARKKAADARALVRDGIDPMDHRDAKRAETKVQTSRGVTFRDYAERYVNIKEAGWKNPKHRQQWRNTLATYCYPVIGNLPVADIDTTAVLAVMQPIWSEKPETASRVRGRIEVILSAAKVEGLRIGENPAIWRGHLDHLLPKRRGKKEAKHHDALPYDQMPKFWQSLTADTSDAAKMLRFIILTACRYNEAAAMHESEVSGDLWTIPGAPPATVNGSVGGSPKFASRSAAARARSPTSIRPIDDRQQPNTWPAKN